MRIGRSYTFQSAHRLPHVLPGHKCGRLHGHTYGLEIEISGTRDPILGWLIDFAQLDGMIERLITSELDHRYLNEIKGLENPTSENLLDWIWDRLSVTNWPENVNLHRVRVSENGHSWCERVPYESM